MTPQEQQLIDSLYEGLRRMDGMPEDTQAAAAIRQQAARTPNAVYWLTQRTLLLEQALQQAQQQIETLQNQQLPARQESPSFLSPGLDTRFGRNPENAPENAAHAAPAPGNWRERWFGAAPRTAPLSPSAATGPGMAGSFLGNAAASAAGVAGGMLLFNGLSQWAGNHQEGGRSSNTPTPDALAQPAGSAGNQAGLDRLSQDAGLDHVGTAGSVPQDNALDDSFDNGDGLFDDDNFA